MREALTSILDALGLLLVASGASAFTFRWLAWGCLLVGGVIVLAGSWLAGMAGEKR